MRSHHAIVVALLGPISLSGIGCSQDPDTTGTGTGASFTLNLLPLTPSNQDSLFGEADTIELVIENTGVEDQVYTLTSTGSGDFSRVEGLSDLVDATLSIRGRTGNTTRFLGRSRPVTSGEDTDVNILVTRADDFGTLGGLKKATWGGAAASDGDGKYFVFGGLDETTKWIDGAYDRVQVIDLKSPEEGLKAHYAAERLPPLSDLPDLPEDESGRVGLTATLLEGTHKDSGKILIIGGAKGIIGTTGMSATSWLFDPATETFEELPEKAATSVPLAWHTASEDDSGNVIIVGGISDRVKSNATPVDEDGTWYGQNGGIRYVAANREMESLDFPDDYGPILGAQASLGSAGTLVCGGLLYTSSEALGLLATPLDTCVVVDLEGNVTETEPVPLPIMQHTMTALPNGRVLLVGGYSNDGLLEAGSDNIPDADGVIESGQAVEASPWIFVYEKGHWTDLADAYTLQNPRAQHGAAVLPDGRVLVVGGMWKTTQAGDFAIDSAAALACAEIINPDTGETFAVGACTELTDTAALPTRAALPMIASDPNHGILVAGGAYGNSVQDGGTATSFSLIYTPTGLGGL